MMIEGIYSILAWKKDFMFTEESKFADNTFVPNAWTNISS